ncbi:MAG: Asp-tRNA(Asn)/Glu-tRNA(Gln) amidotransferase subunit GatB [Candidatus Nealsonbacteria bacterium]
MYKPTIGLEIHVELKTKSKMFCSCQNNPFESDANSNICPVCTAQPGSLPVINKEAVRKTIKAGLALNCKIAQKSKFDRKNYFYPDLPKGYQISQYDMPFCQKGYLEINGEKIKITRIHLEEDTGSLMHSKDEDSSLVDFNRAGVPLMELVTDPDLTSAQQTKKFAEELRLIARYLDISDADMEKGQMRVEANISVSKDKKLGTKVEVKNLNSFKAVEKAIDYEIERQTNVLEAGDKVIQETRGWDDKNQKTITQRIKEEAHDYRYFPEPDLPTLNLSKEFIGKIKTEIREMPEQKRNRFLKEYGISKEFIDVFVFYKDLGEYFEKVMSELRNWIKESEIKEKVEDEEYKKLSKFTSNYIISDLQGLLKGKSILNKDFLITPENFAEFIALIYQGKLSSKMAKNVLTEMYGTGKDPSHIVEEKGLTQMTDETEIENILKDIISQNSKPVEDYKKGKQNALKFLIGQAMAKTKGRVNPNKLEELFKKIINQ